MPTAQLNSVWLCSKYKRNWAMQAIVPLYVQLTKLYYYV